MIHFLLIIKCTAAEFLEIVNHFQSIQNVSTIVEKAKSRNVFAVTQKWPRG